jgi:hypothetical protein
MAEDIADQLERYSAFQLVRCETVAEKMYPEVGGLDLGLFCPALDPLPYSCMAEWTKRNAVTDEYMTALCGRPAMAQISRDGFSNSVRPSGLCQPVNTHRSSIQRRFSPIRF